jgi:hypothetical protein
MLQPISKDRDNDQFLRSLMENPIINGSLISVSLTKGVDKMVYPKPVKGWVIVGVNKDANVWGSSSIKGLSLNCSVDVDVKVWVF